MISVVEGTCLQACSPIIFGYSPVCKMIDVICVRASNTCVMFPDYHSIVPFFPVRKNGSIGKWYFVPYLRKNWTRLQYTSQNDLGFKSASGLPAFGFPLSHHMLNNETISLRCSLNVKKKYRYIRFKENICPKIRQDYGESRIVITSACNRNRNNVTKVHNNNSI